MINCLQTRPTKSQRKVKLKSTAEIGNNSWARLIFLLGKMDGPTLRQMLGTMLKQQLLQDSTMNGSSDYVARTCLTLITLWNVQLNIQMP